MSGVAREENLALAVACYLLRSVGGRDSEMERCGLHIRSTCYPVYDVLKGAPAISPDCGQKHCH